VWLHRTNLAHANFVPTVSDAGSKHAAFVRVFHQPVQRRDYRRHVKPSHCAVLALAVRSRALNSDDVVNLVSEGA
jgi:hypothetical protein